MHRILHTFVPKTELKESADIGVSVKLSTIQFINQIATSHALELLDDGASFLGLVPEEEHALGKLLALRLGAEDGLQGIGMITRVPSLCGYGHRRGREVLHLLEVEVQTLG